MLRWRLLIGLVSIFVLLLTVGGYSIWLITRLERDIESILKDNYQSIREAHEIRLALLRMNAFYLKGNGEEFHEAGPGPLEERFIPPLENGLTALRLSAGSEVEKAEVEQLAREIEDYLTLFRKGFDLDGDGYVGGFNALRNNLLAQNLKLTATTQRILELNETETLKDQERANKLAGDTVRFLVGAMIVAFAVFIYTYLKLGRSLITPMEDLTRSIDAVRAGNFEQNVPVKSNDELGRLARAFNAMAEELRAYRRETDDTIVRLNRSIRETIAAFPYPVILLDANDEMLVTNQAAEDFLRGINSPDRVPDLIRKYLDITRRTGTDYLPDGLHDASLFRVNEQEVHYLPRVLRIISPDGGVSGAAVILIDVSRFRWLDDVKTNLISTVSHEIKTPLTGIRMILHLLLEKSSGPLTELQQEMVDSACQDCERLLKTLNSLLELSRMEAGRTHLDLQSVPPRELLEEAREAFQTQADAKEVSLSIHADNDLPNVLADRTRMMHVIGNFTSNALKFAPRGSTVRLSADKVGADFVRLSVIDEGPGIPEEYHARIFDKFFRQPGQHSDGVGLGLSIAREIIHAHDGRIGLRSVPNVATRFYCELPIA